mgnify:CR=1 FL=1
MKSVKILFLGLLICLFDSCTPSISNVISAMKPAEAVIMREDGSYSKVLPIREAFSQLGSNEKLYLATGRVELTEPLELNDLDNIQIIGNKTALVAKIDMPVVTIKGGNNIFMTDLLVVHEIGEWCAQNCVEFYSSSDLKITNCKFDGSGYFGLALSGVTTAIIENNLFYNCEYGLAAWNSSGLAVKGNGFSKNRNLDIMVNEKGQFSNDFMKENTFEDK